MNEVPSESFYYARNCPFCKNGKVLLWHEGHLEKPWYVECMKCFARGPQAESEDEAFRLWNKRLYGTLGDEP